jgi:prepilin-type N-terminal cleavage/methylation domain-containing protein
MRNNKRGFTLIEIIATLVLVGVLSSIAVLFMGNVLKGFTTVKNNSSAALKAQMALNRISLELRTLSSLSALTNNVSITYDNSLGDNRTIKFAGSNIYISTPTDYLLIDNVSIFSLSTATGNMYNIAGETDVAYIDIGFTVSGVSSFSTRIFPRNRIVHP